MSGIVVFATGPRGNGTSLLYRIIDSGDRSQKQTFHLPAYPPEVQDWSELLPRSLFVVIFRGMDYAAESTLARGFHSTFLEAIAEQNDAAAFLNEQLRKMEGRAYSLSYESLIDAPDLSVSLIDRFLRRHGYSGAPLSHEPIRDENAKWREAAA